MDFVSLIVLILLCNLCFFNLIFMELITKGFEFENLSKETWLELSGIEYND